MTNEDWDELGKLREKWLSLADAEAVELHGWLIGVAVAMERRREASPAETDALIAELRSSTLFDLGRRVRRGELFLTAPINHFHDA